VEEYLESIGVLEQLGSPVSTSAVAEFLKVTSASVSEMLQRLAERGLVEYTPYHGATLAEEGRQRVQRLIRRHRLWEVFLNRHLGISWGDVYKEACDLEHATSDLVVEKLAQFLGNPETCPHGGPIPRSDEEPLEVSGIPLAQLGLGQAGKVVSIVNERDAAFLQYVTDLGLSLGVEVSVLEKAPFDDILTIEVGGSTKAIGPEAASFIRVEPI